MYEVRLGEVRLGLTKRRIQRRMNETTVIACFLSFFFSRSPRQSEPVQRI